MSRPLGFALLFLGCGLAVAAFWYWQQGGFDDLESNPSPAALPTTSLPDGRAVPSAEPQRRARPSERGPSPDPGAAAPPVLHIDTLPEQRDVSDAGVRIGARAEEADVDRSNPGHHWRRLPKHGPSKLSPTGPGAPLAQAPEGSVPVAPRASGLPSTADKPSPPGTPVAVPAAPASASSGAKPSPPGAAGKPECEPPWYIDGKGIQRLRPKCL